MPAWIGAAATKLEGKLSVMAYRLQRARQGLLRYRMLVPDYPWMQLGYPLVDPTKPSKSQSLGVCGLGYGAADAERD